MRNKSFGGIEDLVVEDIDANGASAADGLLEFSYFLILFVVCVFGSCFIMCGLAGEEVFFIIIVLVGWKGF